MQEKTCVPAIRFAGFTEDWAQHLAADLAEYSKGIGYSKGDLTETGTPIILYGRLYTKYQFVIDDLDTFAVAKKGSVFSKGGEVIIPASGETAEDIARATAVAKAGVLLGGDLNILRPVEQINPVFLAITISNGKPQEELAKKAQGKSVVHIHNSDIQEVSVSFPTRTEQDRIVNVFSCLDNLIALYQNKYSQLCNVKKSMLEKMFPKEGATVPEIRFAGFEGAWEQRQLGDDLISIQTGTSRLGDESNKGMPLLKMGNIQRGSFSLDKLEYLSENDPVESQNIACYGDFLFNTRNTQELVGKGATWTGESGKYAFNSNIAKVYLQNLDTIFFNYLYNTKALLEQVHARAMGTTSVAAIYPHSLGSITYFVPSIDEQQVIGKFLLDFDHLITLHQRKLERLQHIKKACLEKMFV